MVTRGRGEIQDMVLLFIRIYRGSLEVTKHLRYMALLQSVHFHAARPFFYLLPHRRPAQAGATDNVTPPRPSGIESANNRTWSRCACVCVSACPVMLACRPSAIARVHLIPCRRRSRPHPRQRKRSPRPPVGALGDDRLDAWPLRFLS